MATAPLNRLAQIARLNSSSYSALPSKDSIRVVELKPAQEDETIAFSLSIAAHYQNAEAYNALSYCWGEAIDTLEVRCDGRPFLITSNLHAALLHLRDPHSPRRLWIDAIAINQHDIAERNQQVSIMRQIYEGAQKVDIWLGPSVDITADAVTLIEIIATRCCASKYGSLSRAEWVKRLRREDEHTALVSDDFLNDLPDVSGSPWLVLQKYYKQPWFTRVWVIQEAHACSDVWVHNGKQVLEWEFVALVATVVCCAKNIDIRRIIPNFEGLRQAFQMRRRFPAQQDAWFLLALARTRQFNATDPRDKVFATLQYGLESVADEMQTLSTKTTGTHLDMQVDYNMTTEQVYRDVVLRWIDRHGSLEVLYFVDPNIARNSDYPSWIPRWDINTGGYSFATVALGPTMYAAGTGRIPSTSSRTVRSVTLQGIRIGDVSHTGSVLPIVGIQPTRSYRLLGPDSHLGPDLLDTLSRLATQDTVGNGINFLSSTRIEQDPTTHFANFAACMLKAIGDTPRNVYVPLATRFCDACSGTVADTDLPSEDCPYSYRCESCNGATFDCCVSCYRLGKRCLDSDHDMQINEVPALWYVHDEATFKRLKASASEKMTGRTGNADDFGRSARTVCYSRTFFSTTTAWIGNGPLNMQVGDTIAVLYGGRMPFVLRRIGDCYRLVGGCYVQGMMDGEAIERHACGDFEEIDFEII